MLLMDIINVTGCFFSLSDWANPSLEQSQSTFLPYVLWLLCCSGQFLKYVKDVVTFLIPDLLTPFPMKTQRDFSIIQASNICDIA